MSFRNPFAAPRAMPFVFSLAILGFLIATGPSFATTAIVRDANSIQLGDVTYRLDGIDAPELDQVCIDSHADAWTCGQDARGQLVNLIGNRSVRCEDVGPEKRFGRRHRGICTAEGDKVSLNEQLVQQGLALARDPSPKAHLAQVAAEAKEGSRGLWNGCFVAPHEFRTGKKDGALLGAACPADRATEIRAVLFPEYLAMPPNCSIKGKFALRARVTGNIGIYHLRGCPSYAATTRPDRWFCSEDDAQAAGFRRAFNCRPSHAK